MIVEKFSSKGISYSASKDLSELLGFLVQHLSKKELPSVEFHQHTIQSPHKLIPLGDKKDSQQTYGLVAGMEFLCPIL